MYTVLHSCNVISSTYAEALGLLLGMHILFSLQVQGATIQSDNQAIITSLHSEQSSLPDWKIRPALQEIQMLNQTEKPFEVFAKEEQQCS